MTMEIDEDEDGWSYSNKPLYQSTMVAFMSFFHGVQYENRDTTFTRAELLEISPKDIKRWFADKAYGEKPKRPGAPAGDLIFQIELIKILN